MADAATEVPSDYVMIKRKKTIFFLYLEAEDTVHDLRARINHVTKVPTTDVKFFIDKDGEVAPFDFLVLASRTRLGKLLKLPEAVESACRRTRRNAHPRWRRAAATVAATQWRPKTKRTYKL